MSSQKGAADAPTDLTPQLTDAVNDGQRAQAVYVEAPVDRSRTRNNRMHQHNNNIIVNGDDDDDDVDDNDNDDSDNSQTEVECSVSTPAQRVQAILAENSGVGAHISHPLFSELQLLVKEDSDYEWRETARWIKFEEDVEEGGNRWSKPHVAILPLQALVKLRSLLSNGTVVLDIDASNINQIVDLICENLINAGELSKEAAQAVKSALLRRHRHQHQFNTKTHLPILNSKKKKTNAKHLRHSNDVPMITEDMVKSQTLSSKSKDFRNTSFMRKIPRNAEANNVLVGELDTLEKPISAFVRLKKATVLGDLTEVAVPTRFIFVLLGPAGSQSDCHEIGRTVGAIMSDEIFHEVSYCAHNREHLIAGVDEFLDAVTVLPPGKWDPNIRIEPPAAIPSQDERKRPPAEQKKDIDEEEEEHRLRVQSGLTRTGRIFGGLVNDIKRKAPWYWSDFRDALSMQCVASWFFLYFACLSPIITFGGLLGQVTGNNMAAMESLVSGFVCGVGFGLFSGQPLNIMGSTGPVLVFEKIVYDFCQNQGWEYMTFRFWIGAWIAALLIILTAIDASAYVCYITRFTEENFAALIAIIFIYESVENILNIGKEYPVHNPVYDCICTPPIGSNASILDYAKYDKTFCLANNGTLVGADCIHPETSNVFLMSVVVFLGTFIISVILKNFKNALFFPAIVRQYISDFAVLIAILSMSYLDYTMQVATPKLEVPNELKPTLPTRGWLIPPFSPKNPWWAPLVGVFPAIFGTILIFMDQQITAVIVNRKENKLKKGCGYHLDLFVLSFLTLICSFLGIPWSVASTVLSINHVNSLKLESECSAPGEKPQFLGVREQRVTHVFIFATIGLSVTLTPLLRHIPMPVLIGVFMYMGAASLKDLQFYDRILIMFMPAKYQPDYAYLRQVPIKRVHLFTLIQLGCFILLWLIKSFSQTSILFPLMLVVIVCIRKSLDLVFTRRELKILDDLMPETSTTAPADDLHQLDVEVGRKEKLLTYLGDKKHSGSGGFINGSSLNSPNDKDVEAVSSLLQK